MRVLHVIARLNVGGTSRWIETLTAEQAAAGQEVLVAAGEVQGGEAEDAAAYSLPLVRIDRLGRAVSPYSDVTALRSLRDVIGDWRPDVINTHTAKAGLLGRLAARSFGRQRPAIVHTVHGSLLTGYFTSSTARAVMTAERLMAHASDLILTVGSRVRDDLVAAGIAPPDQVVAVRPGLRDYPTLARARARQQLGVGDVAPAVFAGWLGRMTRIKRPDRLLGAAAALPEVAFLAGGGGELLEGFVERAPHNVKAVGWVDKEPFWSAVDLAVLTSDNEGMPTALIEAALAGVPAVTTEVGSASEVVVDGVTGLVVEPSVGAVARAVKELASDPVAMASMGAAARMRALEAFSPEAMLAEHTAAYRRALERRA